MNLHLKRYNKIIFSVILCGLLSSCEGRNGTEELEDARQLSTINPQEAFAQYRKVIQLYPHDPISVKAAIEASSLCYKEKSCADNEEFFLRYIIEKSTKEKEQIAAQKRLAEFYYDKGFYPKAIEEMSRLLSKKNFEDGRSEIKIKLAKSNFYIKNFYQAEVELDSYIKEVKTDHGKFEGYLLKADIQAANKKYEEALETYKKIKNSFKDLYFRNQVYMNEVLLLEEQKLLDQAVEALESVFESLKTEENLKIEKDQIAFIESKIQKLKERKALMPGASGHLKR